MAGNGDEQVCGGLGQKGEGATWGSYLGHGGRRNREPECLCPAAKHLPYQLALSPKSPL